MAASKSPSEYEQYPLLLCSILKQSEVACFRLKVLGQNTKNVIEDVELDINYVNINLLA